jgi:hypothetical protein
MSVNILLKRSSTANKRPTAAQAPVGSLVLNYDAATGGVFYQDAGGGIVKVGPAQVSATAPNATAAGSAGNSAGEFWYDTANSTLKVWTGSAWASAGTAGAVTSVTGTAPITVNNTTPTAPVIGISAASTTAAGAVQLNDTINSTSTTLAATANSVKLVADLANTMLPLAGGTMTGAIVFAAGQTFPITGIQDATGAQKGVVQIGANITVTSGTISVANATSVVPGVVTVGSNIQVAAGSISVLSSSTSQPGVVQLNDTVTSTSVTEALTANQGRNLQGQINTLVATSNLTLAGTINASNGNMITVTSAGASANYTVGAAMPAAAPANDGYFAIVTTAGSFTPPGGVLTAFNTGDWVLSNGTGYERLAVGFSGSAATTTSAGLVTLATDAEVQAGVNTTDAVTPSGLQSKLSDSTSTTSSTTIASSTAVKAAFDLATAAVPKNVLTAAGNLLYATAASTPAALNIGTAGQVLIVNPGATAPTWSSDIDGGTY